MRIVVDAFGGDNAPKAIIEGAVMAKAEYDCDIVLTGEKQLIKAVAFENSLNIENIEIVETTQIIDYEDDAKAVVKSKKDSSMAVGLRMVADGEADAFVTAGPTGAALMGATLIVKRLEGVKRPALGTILPTVAGPCFLVDCGANVECRPEMLDQFAVMGSIYMQKAIGVEKPRVALANNGAEEHKGTELQQQAYKLLQSNNAIHFIGNAEGRDVPEGMCDVVVCDGFTGNIMLKTMEGMGSALTTLLKEALMANTKSKLAALTLKKELKGFKKKLDYSEYGGAPFIGLKKPVIKAHGSSNGNAIKNAIRQAVVWSSAGVTEEIAAALSKK